MPSVIIYEQQNHQRSRAVCRAMLAGIERCGDRVRLEMSPRYRGPDADVAVFYGLTGNLRRAFTDYPAAGRKAVYVDLGYWGRKAGGRFAGYHKISVNGRHPTGYFQARPHPNDRIKAHAVEAVPWRMSRGPRSPILIAGMGPKGAAAEGYPPLGWEHQTVRLLREYTRRPILYRPKPNWERPPMLHGATMLPLEQTLEEAVQGCHAVVAHHSNAVVEAIAMGVPGFVVEGVAEPMALTDFALIETPARPDGREQWLADIGYCQWSIAEMAEGLAWRHLKEEGLVP